MQLRKVNNNWFIATTDAGLFFADSETEVILKAGTYGMPKPTPQHFDGSDTCEADGYMACKKALEDGISAWQAELCPYAIGTAEWNGWQHCVKQEASARRLAMAFHAATPVGQYQKQVP